MKLIKETKIENHKSKIIKFGLYLCDCGSLTEKRMDNVKYGNTSSCGKCKKTKLQELPKFINSIEILEDLGMNNQANPKREALFKCNFCGNSFISTINAVKTGNKKSCGCLIKTAHRFKHLKTKHPLYRKWAGMISRTENQKEKSYKNYGHKNIKVCDEWRNDFMSFYDWAINNNWEYGLTIDRINVNGNYEPSNCQWITMKANSIKDRKSTYIKKYLSKNIIDKYVNTNITITQLAKEFKTYKQVISEILKENNITILKTRRLNVSKC